MDEKSMYENGANITELTVINYESLISQDPAEADLMFSACASRGFFYLDLGGSQSLDYLDTVDKLFDVSKEYFSKPLTEKLKDMRDEMKIQNICGYKPMGMDLGNMRGKKDGCEGMRFPVDILYSPGTNPDLWVPEGIKNDWPVVASFIHDSRSICNTIMESLSTSLGLKGDQKFQFHHQQQSESTSTAVLQCYPLTGLPSDTSVGHFTHTDAGSVSVLFSSHWGLQVFSEERNEFEYVPPRSNCAIVNIGDSLKFLSNFKLKSSLHRVVPCREHWISSPRYSCIFFLRPALDAQFVDVDGTSWTAGEWLNRKFSNYRRPHEEQEQTAMATGRRQFAGLWEGQQ